jgi:hypothetical protein
LAERREIARSDAAVSIQPEHTDYVIIACHEAPRIDKVLDGRVTIRQVDFDIPRFLWEMEIDRMRKAEVLGAALRAQGAGWMFLLVLLCHKLFGG